VLVLSAVVVGFGCFVTGMYAFVGLPWLGFALAAVSAGAAVVGVLLLALSAGLPPHERVATVPAPPISRTRRRVLAAAASAVLLGVVALGVADAVVWMPEALVPGMDAAEIRNRMDAAGELSWALSSITTWAVIWAVVALAPMVIAMLPIGPRMLPRTSSVALLALVAASAAIFFQWMGSFSMGMGVADTFGVGGGQSGFWVFYSLLGQASLIGAIALAIGVPSRGDGVVTSRA
jgi:hypothetical protein